MSASECVFGHLEFARLCFCIEVLFTHLALSHRRCICVRISMQSLQSDSKITDVDNENAFISRGESCDLALRLPAAAAATAAQYNQHC